MDEWRGLKPLDSYIETEEESDLWKNAVRYAETLDKESQERFNQGDLYESVALDWMPEDE